MAGEKRKRELDESLLLSGKKHNDGAVTAMEGVVFYSLYSSEKRSANGSIDAQTKKLRFTQV
jgi:hypothetical protein